MIDGDRVAIVLLSALGDVIHGFPLVASIRDACPNASIDWIVEPGYAPLVARHRDVDRIRMLDRDRGWRGFRDFRRDLGGARFDLVVVPQVYGKATLATLLLRAPRKIGFDRGRTREGGWLATNERIRARPSAHVLDQYMEFADHLVVPRRYRWPIELRHDDRAIRDTILQEIDRPVAAIVVGTSRRIKEWPAHRWAKVAEALHDTWGYAVVLLGGDAPAERAIARAVVEQARCPIRDERRQDLPRLAALLDAAALVVSPDTGPYHLALALDVPAIGLYGATDPARVGPAHRYLELVVDAWRDPGEPWHPPRMDVREGRMDRIVPETVLEKVALARSRYPRAVEGPWYTRS